MSRKHPKQQLAAYFDELLTELEENQSTTQDTQQPLPTKPEPAKAIQTIKYQRPDPIAPTKTPIDTPLPQAIAQPNVAEQSDTIKPVAERDEALHQLQQETLQRLLRNLAPYTDEQTPDIDQAEIEEKFFATTTDDIESISISPTSLQAWEPLSSRWLDNGRPCWAQEDFDVLIVVVSGVKLAVPVRALDSIYPIEGPLGLLLEQTSWFMGLQQTLRGSMQIVNTGKFVMPERYHNGDEAGSCYSVVLNSSQWALAIHDIHEPANIAPDEIQWRKKRDNRPWVAGIVKEHMCILLDIPVLVETLNQQTQQEPA